MVNLLIAVILTIAGAYIITIGLVKIISMLLIKYPKIILKPLDLVKEQETLNSLKIKLKDLLNKEKESKLQK